MKSGTHEISRRVFLAVQSHDFCDQQTCLGEKRSTFAVFSRTPVCKNLASISNALFGAYTFPRLVSEFGKKEALVVILCVGCVFVVHL